MNKRILAMGALLLLGAGCTFRGNTADNTDNADQAANGDTGIELCVRTTGDVEGGVSLFAANVTAGNRVQWFTDTPVADGEGGEDMCGQLAFAVMPGDKVAINGDWSSGSRWLVENRTPDASGSDNIEEIWIDDQYYAVGKECAYESNGEMGFDVVCEIR